MAIINYFNKPRCCKRQPTTATWLPWISLDFSSFSLLLRQHPSLSPKEVSILSAINVCLYEYCLCIVAATKVNRMKQLYPCIPEYQTRRLPDPFDYKLRSKQEVIEQHKMYPPEFFINMVYRRYMSTDLREHTSTNTESRERTAKILIDLRCMKLAPL